MVRVALLNIPLSFFAGGRVFRRTEKCIRDNRVVRAQDDKATALRSTEPATAVKVLAPLVSLNHNPTFHHKANIFKQLNIL
jgi:hypothetical protein